MPAVLDFERLLTEPEMEKKLSMPPGSLTKKRFYGRAHPPFLKLGKSVRYRESDVVAWLEAHTVIGHGQEQH